MGKRFHAQYFVESGHEETHGCDYLLATDIDMETVPGYRVASWEKGYGDFVLKPDLATLCLTPWLPGTALVLCDVLDHHTHAELPTLAAGNTEETAGTPEQAGHEGLYGFGTRILPVRRKL